MAAGVFYVKIQGNLPIDENTKRRLDIGGPRGPDVQFAQGNITATGGHPIRLINTLHSRGYYAGFTKEQLNNTRYFTIDSEKDIDEKWPGILKYKPDFLKVLLCNSDDFELTRNDSGIWYKGVDPNLLPALVKKAHGQGFRVSVHINNAADFRQAIAAGADEIAHMPRMISGKGYEPLSAEDARAAARLKVPVITTLAISLFQGNTILPADFPLARKRQAADLKTLFDNGVVIGIGTDNPEDTGVKEVFYLKELEAMDNAALLTIWTTNTAKIIFPGRKIGELKTGYEASFVALKGNPLEDFENVKNIALRFKQGVLINE